MLIDTNLSNVVHKGKVRDTYDLGSGRLLMVATDRISAFDVVLPTGIPGKGIVLSKLSSFWFDKTADLIPNHLICMATDADSILHDSPVGPVQLDISQRSMVVRKAQRVDIECIVRGYLAGSAWAEYRKQGTIFGKPAAKGLSEAQKFDQPIFTPTTKADEGHDEDISLSDVADLVGAEVARELQEKSLSVYEFASKYALEKGIILADTKLEFGFIDDRLTLIDEIFTPDSSRFWDASRYSPGQSPPNFDKQFVRDWLIEQGWNRVPPAPSLPLDVVTKTANRYIEAYHRLTGQSLSDQ